MWLAALAAGSVGALAKKPPEPEAPDPLVLARAEEDRACAADVPENYQIHTGYGSGPEAAAVVAAVEDARKRALSTVCSGKSPTRCEVLARHVEAWKTPYWNPVTERACAHAGVRRDYLDDDRGDQQRLAAELSRLGADLAGRLGSAPVWIDPPTWSTSGCHAGPAGSAMVAELKNALASAGAVRLASQTEAATRVHLALDLRATDVIVSASVTEKGKLGESPMVGFTVPGDLFDLREAGADCRFDSELGLTAGQRPGADGRTVRITVPGEGVYCEGDPIEPRLVVDRPSTVKVFSVARDGTAYLVWPPPGHDGRVDGAASLGELITTLPTEPGDEKLVAIAAAVGGDLGAATRWSGFCQAPRPLTAAEWSSSAAAGSATFVVLPHDAAGCLRRGVTARPPQGAITAPVCK